MMGPDRVEDVGTQQVAQPGAVQPVHEPIPVSAERGCGTIEPPVVRRQPWQQIAAPRLGGRQAEGGQVCQTPSVVHDGPAEMVLGGRIVVELEPA